MPISPDPGDWLLAGLATVLWLAFSLHALLPRRKPVPAGGLLLAYASQSGQAEAMARRDAARLPAGQAQVLPLDHLGTDALAGAKRAVFYIATTGDGDPPDNAAAFATRHMRAGDHRDLGQLSYALLALGDRSYPRFCGFGRAMDDWLQARGATPLFPRVELDTSRPEQVLPEWQSLLADTLGMGRADPGDGFAPWRLSARRLLNPGSPGAPLYHLCLTPEGDLPDWQAGDIATCRIPSADGALLRDYSLASLPASGRVELLVRLAQDAQGRPGRGSSYLTDALAPGEQVALRLRGNPGFRSLNDQAPMILIGNGSGLSGLLAHLRARASLPTAGPVWLMYGERTRAHDAHFDAELQGHLASGALTRLDRAFSRDGGGHVQGLLMPAAADLRDWVARGAVIHLCGQRLGMAEGVQAALAQSLGPAALARLSGEGRLRLDVY